MKKKLSVGLLSLIMAFNTYSFIGHAEDGISVTLNGEALTFDVPPQLIDNRTMVPLRKIFEAMGAVVDWNNDSQTVTATKGNERVIATINSKNVYISGDTKTLDVPPMVVDGRTLVPVRFVAESFGANVTWDEGSRTVIINTAWDGTGEVPCYNKYPTVPDFGAIIGVHGTEENADSKGGSYKYETKNISSLTPYVSAMERVGYKIKTGASDNLMYTGTKDGTYVDIWCWNDDINIIITLPKDQVNVSTFDVQNFTKGFELADFSKYNSPASENGLGDTPVYINCAITKVEIMDIGNDVTKAIVGYATDDGNNQWFILLNGTILDDESTFKNIIGQPLILCGIYQGYSEVKSMPHINLSKLYVKNTGNVITGIEALLTN